MPNPIRSDPLLHCCCCAAHCCCCCCAAHYVLLCGLLLSPISAPAAGPFSPQISPEGIARVPPTQLGPAPAAELPRGGLKIKCSTKTNHRPPRGSEFVTSFASHQIWLAATNRLRTALRAVRGMTQCPLATGMTKISRPKGKYSVDQAVTKYLAKDFLFCSGSAS
jgi:hypothetical protein